MEILMKKVMEKTVGRPRIHQDAASRVAAFRAKAKYPGHRCDVYLEEHSYLVLCMLKKKTGLSTSGVINSILSGAVKVPVVK
jgi:hypothetical protein